MLVKENLAMPDHVLEDETNQETIEETALTSGADNSMYSKDYPTG